MLTVEHHQNIVYFTAMFRYLSDDQTYRQNECRQQNHKRFECINPKWRLALIPGIQTTLNTFFFPHCGLPGIPLSKKIKKIDSSSCKHKRCSIFSACKVYQQCKRREIIDKMGIHADYNLTRIDKCINQKSMSMLKNASWSDRIVSAQTTGSLWQITGVPACSVNQHRIPDFSKYLPSALSGLPMHAS